ncbi:MAG: GNAT family N-acetyltransferase [Bacteroidota bacterium]
MKNIQFKAATEEDRTFFIYVHHTAYRETVEKQFGWEEKVQDEFANKAFDEEGIHLIIYKDQKIGVVGWETLPTHLLLKELFILPEFQGNGIGTEILKHTKERARELAKPIRLGTLRTNQRAKKLYEKHGFQVEEETDRHWKLVWGE